MDLVTSMKALNKTVEAQQLTSDLGGSFTYSHADWLQFHQVPVFPAVACVGLSPLMTSPVHPLVNPSPQPNQTLLTAFVVCSVWFVCEVKGGCVHKGKVLSEGFRLSKGVFFKTACQHKRMRMCFINDSV